MKCPKCGETSFYAVQLLTKYQTVVVDEDGYYVKDANVEDFRHPDADDCVDCNSPEGPYYCVNCREEVEDDGTEA